MDARVKCTNSDRTAAVRKFISELWHALIGTRTSAESKVIIAFCFTTQINTENTWVLPWQWPIHACVVS